MKRMRRWLVMGAVLLSAMIAACAFRPGTVAGEGDGEPAGQKAGYYGQGQKVSGGSQLQDANLKDIRISQQNEETVVTLRFRQGSDDSGVSETELSTVPRYALSSLPGISRFALSLEGVAYWDYAVYQEELNASVIEGVFHDSSFEEQRGKLYLILREACDFRAEQTRDQLKLYFSPRNEGDTAQWYVTVNGYDLYPQHENQQLLDELTLYPTLCSDLNSKVLLSRPFATREDAQAFLNQHQEAICRLLPGRVSALVELSGTQLPDYDEQAQILSLMDTPIGRKNGQDYEATVMEANARFLCWNPEGGYIYTKSTEVNTAEAIVGYEQLWIKEQGGEAQQVLPGHEFSSVVSAAYSADGRYLAVLGQDIQASRNLEIIDMERASIYDPVERGFGVDTPGYVWDESRPVLYAITGEGEGLTIMAYDLTDPDNPQVTEIDGTPASDSLMDIADRTLYFIKWSQDISRGQLYSLNMDTGDSRVLTGADSFALSPNNKWAAVSGDNPDSGQGYLNLYNFASGQAQKIAENKIVMNLQWDGSGDLLYYTVYNQQSEDANLPLELYRYDVTTGANEKMMDMVPATLYPGRDSRTAVLVYIFTQANQPIPMSYLINME